MPEGPVECFQRNRYHDVIIKAYERDIISDAVIASISVTVSVIILVSIICLVLYFSSQKAR